MKDHMHPHFGQLMKDATAHTRAGNLPAAMAAIAAALERGPTVMPSQREPTADVIDVMARVVLDEPSSPIAHSSARDLAKVVNGCHVYRRDSRDYRLFIPADQAGKPRSLIVMLHGCTQNPDDFARGTRMDALGAEHNALVLYPAQKRQANAQGCWNWFKHSHQQRERGEPALIADMASQIAQTHGVARDRVFVAGLSAGGAMAAILASTHPDVFAAAGVHSGLPAGAARDLPGALAVMKGQGSNAQSAKSTSGLRMIVFHGDADATVHPINGDHVARAHGGSRVEEQGGLKLGARACTRRLYRDAQGRVVTEQWVVHGAGHAWSGGDPSGSYADERGPDASAEMMRFFLT